MKLPLLIVIYITLITFPAKSQVPSWAWARSAGGVSGDNSNAVTTDNLGNVYISGNYRTATLNFGNGVTLTKPTNTQDDVFAAKYDAAGNALWAVKGIGNHTDGGLCSITDSDNNLYLTGYFRSESIDFDGTVLTAGEGDKIFLNKYTTDGTLSWAKVLTEGGFSYITQMVKDADGNIYGIGRTNAYILTVDGTHQFNSFGGQDILIIKFNANGEYVWAKRVGGYYDDEAKSIAIDAEGAIYVAGFFNSSSISFDAITLTQGNSTEAFLVKYDSNGNALWAVMQGGVSSQSGEAVTVDNQGFAYMSGSFSATLTMGNSTFTNSGLSDIFIGKYESATGSLVWGTAFGGNSSDNVESLKYHSGQGLLVGGNYYGSQITIGTTVLNNQRSGYQDMYVGCFSTTGDALWAKTFGSQDIDGMSGLTVSNSGSTYVTGVYDNRLVFDNMQLTYTGTGFNFYLAKLDTPALATDSVHKKPSINVYPNPIDKVLHIESNIPVDTITIYDMSGKEIYSDNHSTLSANISTDKISTGIYSLCITINNNKYTYKIIK